jgi:hypothetical protein
MGIPWFVAATVLSINHVNSLKLESECAAPGEKPQFLGVREQRVTHLLIFLTIGLSVLLTPLLSVSIHYTVYTRLFTISNTILVLIQYCFSAHSNASTVRRISVHGSVVIEWTAIFRSNIDHVHASQVPTRLHVSA